MKPSNESIDTKQSKNDKFDLKNQNWQFLRLKTETFRPENPNFDLKKLNFDKKLTFSNFEIGDLILDILKIHLTYFYIGSINQIVCWAIFNKSMIRDDPSYKTESKKSINQSFHAINE